MTGLRGHCSTHATHRACGPLRAARWNPHADCERCSLSVSCVPGTWLDVTVTAPSFPGKMSGDGRDAGHQFKPISSQFRSLALVCMALGLEVVSGRKSKPHPQISIPPTRAPSLPPTALLLEPESWGLPRALLRADRASPMAAPGPPQSPISPPAPGLPKTRGSRDSHLRLSDWLGGREGGASPAVPGPYLQGRDPTYGGCLMCSHHNTEGRFTDSHVEAPEARFAFCHSSNRRQRLGLCLDASSVWCGVEGPFGLNLP